jgi:hypothetical protein
VFDILDLIPEFASLFLLRADELLAPLGAFLLSIDLLGKMFLQFVLVLPLGAEQASIQNVRGRSIMGYSYMVE